MMRRALLPLFVAAVVACDHNGGTVPSSMPMLNWGPASTTLFVPPADGAPIVGDWFVCATDDCSAFTSDGFRFDASGRFTVLSTAGNDQPCVKDDAGDKGTYTYDGTSLTLMSDSCLSATIGFIVDGDTGKVTISSQGTTVTVLVRRRPIDRSLESCPVAVPGTGN